VPAKNGFAWRCTAPADEFDFLLWQIVHAAVALLTGPYASRIRSCASESCDWMFVDRSKRGNRRWCDMTVCGNRAKARRFYERRKRRSRG
jgi:predicted RNA-binding Zn ribbon-like protein